MHRVESQEGGQSEGLGAKTRLTLDRALVANFARPVSSPSFTQYSDRFPTANSREFSSRGHSRYYRICHIVRLPLPSRTYESISAALPPHLYLNLGHDQCSHLLLPIHLRLCPESDLYHTLHHRRRQRQDRCRSERRRA